MEESGGKLLSYLNEISFGNIILIRLFFFVCVHKILKKI